MATATNPFTEAGLIQTLRGDGIRAVDLDDDALLVIIADSLFEYLFYRPKLAITTSSTCLTTVADQPNYAKPTGALIIVDVCWNPGISADVENLFLQELDTRDSTLLMLQYDEISKLHRMFGGSWKILNDEIWLMPTPVTADTKVAVIYTTGRSLEELDMIADRRFYDLCKYRSMLAVGEKKLVGGGWRAGAYNISEAVGRESVKHANKKLEETRLLLAQSYSGRT